MGGAYTAETLAHKKPKKADYRQRAHCNPLADSFLAYPPSPEFVDWSMHFPGPLGVASPPRLCLNTTDYPIKYEAPVAAERNGESGRSPDFLDVGCGFGGLLISLAPQFPQSLIMGLEIREKVTNFVGERIQALREEHKEEGLYQNVSVIRTNATKFLLNYFRKGQCVLTYAHDYSAFSPFGVTCDAVCLPAGKLAACLEPQFGCASNQVALFYGGRTLVGETLHYQLRRPLGQGRPRPWEGLEPSRQIYLPKFELPLSDKIPRKTVQRRPRTQFLKLLVDRGKGGLGSPKWAAILATLKGLVVVRAPPSRASLEKALELPEGVALKKCTRGLSLLL
ncbi:tRNA-methyltransferase family protein [Cyclospora cayetanensis]|uniref:tRNA (guanine(46)-N(7))-methyltransferase n=1 Tax=Cyclospora cayetanensis TaxID=88456 RepID=A0A1D3D2M9_9EIME|nr:tRNA-methyltransferase family protein [Cyclospora cayetanensis]